MSQTMKPVPPKVAPLGRGLSALFGDADKSYAAKPAPIVQAVPAPSAATPMGNTLMPITWLQPGAFQPRRFFDEAALQGLAESIKERGILEPLVVRPLIGAKDSYEIIAGERRWRASQMAGLHNIPVIVRNLTDREALEFGLIENVQRQDLSPMEEAEGYKRLMDEFSHTQEGLAKIVGKSRPHIANMLRILGLPEKVKAMVAGGQLSFAHARALVPTVHPLQLAEMVVKKGLNVRQTEALAKRDQDAPQIHKSKTQQQKDLAVTSLEKDLERVIGLKVKVEPKGKGGSFTLFYHDLDQLDMIIKRLKVGT